MAVVYTTTVRCELCGATLRPKDGDKVAVLYVPNPTGTHALNFTFTADPHVANYHEHHLCVECAVAILKYSPALDPVRWRRLLDEADSGRS